MNIWSSQCPFPLRFFDGRMTAVRKLWSIPASEDLISVVALGAGLMLITRKSILCFLKRAVYLLVCGRSTSCTSVTRVKCLILGDVPCLCRLVPYTSCYLKLGVGYNSSHVSTYNVYPISNRGKSHREIRFFMMLDWHLNWLNEAVFSRILRFSSTILCLEPCSWSCYLWRVLWSW